MREILNTPPGRQGNVWFAAPRGRLHPRHHHAELEFNLVISGSARYALDDRAYHLASGANVWLFPAQEHRLLDMSRDFTMWTAIIAPQLLSAVTDTAGPRRDLVADDPSGSFCRQLPRSSWRFLCGLCADLADETCDPCRFNAGIGYLFLTAWDSFRQAEATASLLLHPGIECALRLLDRDPELDAAALAEESGLSRSHFSRLFHRQLGQTLVDYRSRLRVDRVRASLRDDSNLLELALAAGFGSYAQFHRAVKRHCGCSPRELAALG
jgi:AraC-like DNA-binding protein